MPNFRTFSKSHRCFNGNKQICLIFLFHYFTYITPHFSLIFYKLYPTLFRPPFGVPSRPGNPTTYRPNIIQPQPNFNSQEMDPSMFVYAQILGMGDSQLSLEETEPDIETVPKTQP
ncbi:hypothetical protein Hanom_Chr17g01577141 [Helianthus anomalus]